MSTRRILLLIAAFLALTLGSFVWYVATWEARKGATVGHTVGHLAPAPLHFAITIPAGGSAAATGTAACQDCAT